MLSEREGGGMKMLKDGFEGGTMQVLYFPSTFERMSQKYDFVKLHFGEGTRASQGQAGATHQLHFSDSFERMSSDVRF